MNVERYHGSHGRAVAERISTMVSNGVREFARSHFRRHADQLPSGLDALLKRADALAGDFDFDGALIAAREAADIAEKDGRVRAKRLVGNRLLPLGDCGRGLQFLAEPLPFCRAREWQGQRLSGRRLFVRQLHTSNMGAPIRMARFVAQAVKMAAHCVVIVEPRLVPIFRRSFPDAEVRPLRFKWILDARPDDYVTSFEGLGSFLVSDWPSVERTFVPLTYDALLAEQLRLRYLSQGQAPLIGIAWGSTNERKQVPEFAAWQGLISETAATFVSLQYGPIGPALARLRGDRPAKLIDDASVDQMQDMDRFAAQVGALDGIITITNTGAHVGGALGKPTILPLDDRYFGAYPAHGTRSYWYPSTTILRRNERPWREVLADAATRLGLGSVSG